MSSPDRTAATPSNADAFLLEGLCQLVLDGATDSWEFEQLDAEVYDRLQATYAPEAGPVAPLLAS